MDHRSYRTLRAALSPTLLVGVVAGCSPNGKPAAPEPFGRMPSASTTAVAEWMPWRARAGIEAVRDDRETQLENLRRVSFGSVDSGPLWWGPRGRTLYALRRDGDCQRVYRIDLGAEDRNPSEPLRCITPNKLGWSIQPLERDGNCGSDPSKLAHGCGAFMNGRRAARSPDRSLWVYPNRVEPPAQAETAKNVPRKKGRKVKHDKTPSESPKTASAPVVRWLLQPMPGGVSTTLRAPGNRVGSATWLKDGKHLLIASNHDSTDEAPSHRSLYVTTLANLTEPSASLSMTRVTFATGDDNHAIFSPDGKWIAFVSTRATPQKSAHHIYVGRWRAPTD